MKSTNYFIHKNLCNKKTKFIFSCLSTLFFNVGAMNCFLLGQFSVYITSYFHYQKTSIDMHYGNFIMPILIFSLSLSAPLGGVLEKKLGMKITLLISSILIEFLLFLFINQVNKLYSLILIVLIGMSVGFGIVIPGKNLCYYYPKRRGLIGSCSQSFMILTGAFISVFGEKIINPNKVVLKEGEIYYPLEISINYIKFYKIALFIIPITSLLSILLIQKYDPLLDKNPIINQENNEIEKNKKTKDKNYSKNIKYALLNNRIWKLAFMSIFTPFSIGFSMGTFRVYGALISINGTIMKYLFLFSGLSSIIFGPIWGIINDKFNFNIIIKIISICSIIHAIILSFFIHSNLIYVICIFVGNIIASGFNTIFQPHMMKIYGMKYYLEIGGVVGITGSIFEILKAILSFIVSKFYHTGKELQIPYRFIYIVGIGLSSVGLYLGITENDKVFDYPFSIGEKNFQNLENISTVEEQNKNNSQERKGKDVDTKVEIKSYNDVELK